MKYTTSDLTMQYEKEWFENSKPIETKYQIWKSRISDGIKTVDDNYSTLMKKE